MSGLLEQVAQTLDTRKLLSRGQRLLVAVSGGVDSMVLLQVLHALAPSRGWRLTVAHFNHQLRGRSSQADERLVRTTARKLGLPFVAGRADVRPAARARKLSLEMAARELRHAFLARTARRRRIPAIALAHHAGDQVELFFLRLLRGGGEGLAGMKWRGISPAHPQVALIRPLLDVHKAALEAFARENRIRHREDASNASLDHQRNRIRHELLPLLRARYQPALDRTILRVMEIAAAESEFVSAAAAREDARPGRRVFSKRPVALQRRSLQQQLRGHGVAPEFELIERLRLHPDIPVTVAPDRLVTRDEAGRLRFHAPPAGRFRAGRMRLDLRRPAGEAVFGGTIIGWKIERQARFVRPKPLAGREWFDAGAVGRQVILRHWRAGDRFQPLGMAAAVKLQDLFVNARIARDRRRELLVATTAAGRIFWVEGLRLGEEFKLGPKTRRRLRWEWRKTTV